MPMQQPPSHAVVHSLLCRAMPCQIRVSNWLSHRCLDNQSIVLVTSLLKTPRLLSLFFDVADTFCLLELAAAKAFSVFMACNASTVSFEGVAASVSFSTCSFVCHMRCCFCLRSLMESICNNSCALPQKWELVRAMGLKGIFLVLKEQTHLYCWTLIVMKVCLPITPICL